MKLLAFTACLIALPAVTVLASTLRHARKTHPDDCPQIKYTFSSVCCCSPTPDGDFYLIEEKNNQGITETLCKSVGYVFCTDPTKATTLQELQNAACDGIDLVTTCTP
jgi:hypothetical protein